MTPKIQPWALPLTQNQTAIWLDELLFEKSPMYNIGAYYEIRGPLEVALFGAALRRLVLEHDVFGLSIEYLEDGQACQHFTPQSDYRLPVLDFSNQEDASSRCVQWMNAHFQEAFDIMQGPLFSFTLLKAGGEHYSRPVRCSPKHIKAPPPPRLWSFDPAPLRWVLCLKSDFNSFSALHSLPQTHSRLLSAKTDLPRRARVFF